MQEGIAAIVDVLGGNCGGIVELWTPNELELWTPKIQNCQIVAPLILRENSGHPSIVREMRMPKIHPKIRPKSDSFFILGCVPDHGKQSWTL